MAAVLLPRVLPVADDHVDGLTHKGGEFVDNSVARVYWRVCPGMF